jgi:hypothetical protein
VNYHVLDIETVPLPDAHERVLAEAFDPEVHFKPERGAKREDTRRRQMEEQATVWEEDRALRASRVSLSPLTGRIAACGGEAAPSPEDERDLIAQALLDMIQSEVTVTFNGLAFDLPFLTKRAAILQVPVPMGLRLSDFRRRYITTPHCDLYMHLSDWERYTPGKLDDWARVFGITANNCGSGADVYGWWLNGAWDLIAAHNTEDRRLTGLLYERVAPYLR